MRFIWNKILVDLLKVGQKVLVVNCDRRPVGNRTELTQSRPYNHNCAGSRMSPERVELCMYVCMYVCESKPTSWYITCVNL